MGGQLVLAARLQCREEEGLELFLGRDEDLVRQWGILTAVLHGQTPRVQDVNGDYRRFVLQLDLLAEHGRHLGRLLRHPLSQVGDLQKEDQDLAVVRTCPKRVG